MVVFDDVTAVRVLTFGADRQPDKVTLHSLVLYITFQSGLCLRCPVVQSNVWVVTILYITENVRHPGSVFIYIFTKKAVKYNINIFIRKFVFPTLWRFTFLLKHHK